jgi:hypothetical protein
MAPRALKFLSPCLKFGVPVFDDSYKLPKPVESLRAMKNLLGISCVIRLNEQIKRWQATRDRRKSFYSCLIAFHPYKGNVGANSSVPLKLVRVGPPILSQMLITNIRLWRCVT